MSFILRSDEKAGEGEETRQGDHGYIFFPITTFLKTIFKPWFWIFQNCQNTPFFKFKMSNFLPKMPPCVVSVWKIVYTWWRQGISGDISRLGSSDTRILQCLWLLTTLSWVRIVSTNKTNYNVSVTFPHDVSNLHLPLLLQQYSSILFFFMKTFVHFATYM